MVPAKCRFFRNPLQENSMQVCHSTAKVVILFVLAAAISPGEEPRAKSAAKPDPKSKSAKPATEVAPKLGVKTPGVLIPFSRIKAEAEIPGAPSWLLASDTLLAPTVAGDALEKIDLKTNTRKETVPGVKQPCAGAVTAFKSLWVPDCAAGTIDRIEPKTGKVEATLEVGAGKAKFGIAATADSIWALTDNKATLSRIDPDKNAVVGEFRLAASCNSMLAAESSLWIVCPAEDKLLRVNPATNLVDQRIKVAETPVSVASGDGSIWVLGLKEGKIDRIDPKTNKVIKTIDLLIPGASEGSIAFGENALWATLTGFPLMRIDTTAEKETIVQQFWGEGGGLIQTAAGSLWLTNPKESKLLRLDPKRVIATLGE
jgi:streptogramin lyase